MNNSNIDVFKVITDVIIFSDLFWSDIIKKFYDIVLFFKYLLNKTIHLNYESSFWNEMAAASIYKK